MNATVSLMVDNFCLVYSGNGASVDKLWAAVGYVDSLTKVTNVSMFDLSEFSFVYLAAWSDCQWHERPDLNGQGLLASVGFAHPLDHFRSGDNSWQVSASNTPMSRGQQPTIEQINGVIQGSRWETPAVGTLSRVGPNNPAGITSALGHWMWCDSQGGRSEDRNRSAEAPFWPGWDHGEFLLFRLPPPRPTKPIDLELFFKVNLPKSENDNLDQSLVDRIPSRLFDLAAYISVTSPRYVNVEGHTSKEGADNDALSLRRAKCVAAWLSNKSGLSSSRIGSQGFGASKAKYNQQTEDIKNRRVAVTLTW